MERPIVPLAKQYVSVLSYFLRGGLSMVILMTVFVTDAKEAAAIRQSMSENGHDCVVEMIQSSYFAVELRSPVARWQLVLSDLSACLR